MKRSPLQRKQALRSGKEKRDVLRAIAETHDPREPGQDRLSPEAKTMRYAWGQVAKRQSCAVCGFRGGRGEPGCVQGHHVVPLRILKTNKIGDIFWWDPRNMLPLCAEPAVNRCHARHEHWVTRVPRAVVLRYAPHAQIFAEEHDLMWRFDMEYPEEMA